MLYTVCNVAPKSVCERRIDFFTLEGDFFSKSWFFVQLLALESLRVSDLGERYAKNSIKKWSYFAKKNFVLPRISLLKAKFGVESIFRGRRSIFDFYTNLWTTFWFFVKIDDFSLFFANNRKIARKSWQLKIFV